ncbi:helix-turn-helix domain-containing protein [Kosakonia sp. S42]|uniref:helix-turn-helix domain-containing protein n=1 Tax=Kosakonia sp. S42 TaxID=2767458 RepID=UPI00190D939F|nr:helix-turn-helix transcriptional regulator [Kosakonia sp. S42]MBK0019458.1 helix-turn-helix transcriptional regulator [Kosakonia sp. S42]
MAIVNYVTDERGVRISAVVPIDLFERLISLNDRNELNAGDDKLRGNEDTLFPHEVVSIMVRKNIGLLAAWRVYRNLTQTEVADLMGVKQSNIAQIEKSDNPRRESIVKLSKIYNCEPEQLIE